VHEEAINAAVALGFKPGKGLRRAVDRDSDQNVLWTEEKLARLPRSKLARIECENIILFLLEWPECADPLQPLTDEIGVACKMLDEPQRDLALALAP
jgi:hypothetical protein